jgi:hypothetical protein
MLYESTDEWKIQYKYLKINLSLYLIKYRVIKIYGVEVQLQVFVISVVDVGD